MLSIPKEPFDEQTIRNIVQSFKDESGFETWYENFNVNRKLLRHGQYPTEIKGISQKLEDLSPAVDVHITRYVNRIIASTIKIENSARSVKQEDVDAAKRVEDFYYSIVADFMQQDGGGSLAPYRRAIDNMVSLGAGVLSLEFKPGIKEQLGDPKGKDLSELVSAAKSAFKDGFQENPFIIRCPALETVFFPEDGSTFVEFGKRTLSKLLLSYDDLELLPDFSFGDLTSDTIPEFSFEHGQDMVTFMRLTTKDWVYDLIEHPQNTDKPFLLERRPNAAGRPLYAIMLGHVNDHESPAFRYKPFVAPLYQVIQVLNVTGTLLQSGALNTGRPMYQQVSKTGRAQTLADFITNPTEQQPVINFSPSEQMLPDPKPDHHWEVVPAPSMEWVQTAYEASERRLETWGFPVSLSPEVSTSGSAESGTQLLSQIEQAANQLNPALDNVAAAILTILNLVADTIKELGVPVTVPNRRNSSGLDTRARDAIKVEPDDFKEQDITVSLESAPGQSKIAERESDLRLVQVEMMSKQEFFKKHYDDWQLQMKQVYLDKGKTFAEEQALDVFGQFLKAQAGPIASEIAAEQGIPLPPLASQDGGPAPDAVARFQRPETPVQAAGTPLVIPPQDPVPVQ